MEREKLCVKENEKLETHNSSLFMFEKLFVSPLVSSFIHTLFSRNFSHVAITTLLSVVSFRTTIFQMSNTGAGIFLKTLFTVLSAFVYLKTFFLKRERERGRRTS